MVPGNKEWQNMNVWCLHLLIEFQLPHHYDRIFKDPCDSDLWLQHESTLKPDQILVGLQLYSDKCLLNSKGRQAHPIRMSILNLEHYTRNQNIVDIGFFPIMQRPGGMSKNQWRKIKLCMHHKCLAELLTELKAASYTGLPHLTDPFGKTCEVVPRLLSYSADDPEAKDCTLVRGGNAKHPCELCMVSRQ